MLKTTTIIRRTEGRGSVRPLPAATVAAVPPTKIVFLPLDQPR
jgi:hypothetical protein